MSRRIVASKDTSTPLPRHHPHKDDYDDDDEKSSHTKLHKTPTFSAQRVIFLRNCVRDFSITNMICIFLCLALTFLTVVEDDTSDPLDMIRRLTSTMISGVSGVSGGNYHLNQPRILQVNLNLSKQTDGADDKHATNIYLEAYQPGISTQEIYISEPAQEAQKLLKNSKKYGRWARDPLHEGDCEPMRDWQTTSFPSCNKMHEMHMEQQFKFLADGGYNTVFAVTSGTEKQVVKILQYDTDHTDRNFDRVRRDSLIMERSTQSPYVVSIYSFCGFAQVVEFGKHGNLDDVTYEHYDDLTAHQKLQIATQVAQGLADVHDMDGDAISSMSHGDYATKQYILIDGRFKLNDFNRGRFIRWNKVLKEPCPYKIGSNDGKFRAPEEYNYIPETAAIDVWALGSIFVELLTGHGVWHGYKTEEAQALIGKGQLPPIPDELRNSKDPVNQVLLKGIELCYVFDPKERPKAGVVVDFLKKEAEKLGVDWHAPFGMDDE